MYDKYIDGLNTDLFAIYDHITVNYKRMGEILDLIIKIKTIQAMDVSAELIACSRRVSRN